MSSDILVFRVDKFIVPEVAKDDFRIAPLRS